MSPPRARSNWISSGYTQALIGLLVTVAAVLTFALLTPGTHIDGKVAPGFQLRSLSVRGSSVSLATDKGFPVVLTFFASWCEPCRTELPMLAKVAQTAGGKVRFIGVDVADSLQGGRQLVRSAGVTYPVGIDKGSRVADGLYHLAGLPDTVFVSAGGRILHVAQGQLDRAQALRWVRKLL
ncbi:MAG: TlpA disulfide reductase family protein [Actinomycetota bacterium]|nr:TlpA disulfide reductase family protein [Actinomycetota bacterium]